MTEVGQQFRLGHRAVLMVAPTGAGKTVMFSHMADTFRSRGKRVLIVAHRKELIKQASSKLRAAGIQHGIIAPWAEQVPELVQVGSVQTLRGRLGRLPRFDLIVIDEAHHSVAGDWARLIASQPQSLICGVTASPQRMDGKALGVSEGGVFETMVLGPTIAELIDLGFLTPSKVFAPSIPDMIGIRTRKGDFDTTQLAKLMAKPECIGNVSNTISVMQAGCRRFVSAPQSRLRKDMPQRFVPLDIDPLPLTAKWKRMIAQRRCPDWKREPSRSSRPAT
nr:DEAD/DEAH box helicase family protein [Asaia astilbis]